MNIKGKELKGRTVLIIAVSAFAVILAANLTLMFAATGTFPGLVVKNTYVASQGWNARTAAQAALGWEAEVLHDGGELTVMLTDTAGAPVEGVAVSAIVGRPATDAEDRDLTLRAGAGGYRAPLTLGPGQWQVVVRAKGPRGARYEVTARLYVPEGG